MSITGQTGHVALAKQTAFGTPNVTAGDFRAVKVTGDSLVATNNMIVAEGEIGSGRDVTQAVPGGFSTAGAVNGNLRARSAAVFLYGSLGSGAVVAAAPGGTPPTAASDDFDVADTLPYFTVEKKVGTTGAQLLGLRYQDAVINTLNISANSGGLSTFSAGIIAAGESRVAPVATVSYPAVGDDLLVFHGGRIRMKDSTNSDALTWDATAYTTNPDYKSYFQSMEVVVNNNVAADEFTIRPSRFLRSFTEGIRSVEVNTTIIFENYADYEKFTYGATGRTAPGYNLYTGAIDFQLANFQLLPTESVDVAAPAGVTNPQGVRLELAKVVFAGLPVTLSTGRIAVSTSGRALKPSTGNIINARVAPSLAGFSTF